MSFADWFTRGYRGSVVDALLGKLAAQGSGAKPPRDTATVAGASVPDVRVTAKIPPVAKYGSYALHNGIDVKITPPPGEGICGIAANEWLDAQLDYYDSEVVFGDLATSTGATRGQFAMRNVTVREDGFSFRFQTSNHPSGMPYAQLATFIEIMKEKPICAVDTDRLAKIVQEELK